MRDSDPGFPTDILTAFTVDPALIGYDSPRTKVFYRRHADELPAIPGVQNVGLADMRILTGNESDSGVTVESQGSKPAEKANPYMNSVGPGYFSTLGVPILAGRDFTFQDTDTIQHGVRPDMKVPRVESSRYPGK